MAEACIARNVTAKNVSADLPFRRAGLIIRPIKLIDEATIHTSFAHVAADQLDKEGVAFLGRIVLHLIAEAHGLHMVFEGLELVLSGQQGR